MKRVAALLLALTVSAGALAQLTPAGAVADHDYLRGLAYRNGEGVPRDAALAVHALTRAAERGVPEAMFILSHMLSEGEGAPRWLETAAQAEYPEALQEMAMTESDPARAAELLREAAHAMQHRAR